MFVSEVDYMFKANAQMDHGMMGNTGTAWGMGVFHSNGDRIYVTAISDRGLGKERQAQSCRAQPNHLAEFSGGRRPSCSKSEKDPNRKIRQRISSHCGSLWVHGRFQPERLVFTGEWAGPGFESGNSEFLYRS